MTSTGLINARIHDEDAVGELQIWRVHAGKPIKDPEEYRVCITCHARHHQLTKTKLPPAFDRSSSSAGSAASAMKRRQPCPHCPLPMKDAWLVMARWKREIPRERRRLPRFASNATGTTRAPLFWLSRQLTCKHTTPPRTASNRVLPATPSPRSFVMAGNNGPPVWSATTGTMEGSLMTRTQESVAKPATFRGLPRSGPRPDRVLWRIDLKPDQPTDLTT